MTLAKLIKQVAFVSGYEEGEVREILSAALLCIRMSLRDMDTVKLRDFGTFFWQYRKISRRKHPSTGEDVRVPERWVLLFRPTDSLKSLEVIDGKAQRRSKPRKSEGGGEV